MLRDLLLLSPLHIVAATAVITLLASVVPAREGRSFLGRLTATGFAAALGAVAMLWTQPDVALKHPSFAASLSLDAATLLVWALLLGIGFVVALLSSDHLGEQGMDHGEYYALTALAVAGMMAMVAAREFFTLFIGLETFSMAVYVLCGFKRNSSFSIEAALKYFILGSFASALLLLGIAFAYGVTGSTSIPELGRALADGPPSAFAPVSIVLLLVGFGFKVAAVPFHAWTPDAYEGAPTPVGALMAAGVKTAAVVTFARVFVTAFTGNGAELLAVSWPRLIEILAALTIVYGNLVALNQLNVKRMLGYSAVAHAGYLLIGVAALPAFAVAGASTHSLGVGSALLYYLLAYSFANLAAFGVLALFGRGGREDLDSFVLSGAARRHPVLALVLSLALISLAGIPPTAGFFGKFLLLRGVLAARPDLLWLIIIAVLGSAASMFYYLRPVIRMYMHPEHEPVRTIRSGAAWAGLAIAAALLLHAGIMPGRYLQATDRASASLDLSPKVVEVVKVTERR